jgi:NAD+ kinase
LKKLAIYGQYLHDDTCKIVKHLLELLAYQDCLVLFEEEFNRLLSEGDIDTSCQSFTEIDASFDLLISIGGDGTILRAAALIGRTGVPVLGINAGRLGFLATVKSDHVEKAVKCLFCDDFKIFPRRLLTVDSKHKELHAIPNNFALNEITVSRMNTTSMIQIETHLNDELLTNYWADGLIISTPTGSTGYSLSCGGPLITPDTDAFVITPIAPHNLNARPLVIPDDTEIKLKIKGREDSFLLSLDNRIESYPDKTTIHLKKADFTIGFVDLPGDSFIKTIRHKLLWGEDHRNKKV